MKRIGLTGNIGTGKSTVARIFEILGVPVYHADKQAREILESEPVKIQLADLFGKQVVNSLNQVDRKALAAIVFNDKNKLDVLNSLIHPLVEVGFSQWCDQHQHTDQKYVLHEAAILFESGFDRLFDANILVTAPEALCVKRVMARDGITKEMVSERVQNQWSQDKKLAMADYQIINDEISMVIPQVLAIHQVLNK
ncbi:MAG: dephospho-CoA kinase [Bacteroidales bacterium]|nr:dephospho-CoA kinase [Bacteroidales bacterium]